MTHACYEISVSGHMLALRLWYFMTNASYVSSCAPSCLLAHPVFSQQTDHCFPTCHHSSSAMASLLAKEAPSASISFKSCYHKGGTHRVGSSCEQSGWWGLGGLDSVIGVFAIVLGALSRTARMIADGQTNLAALYDCKNSSFIPPALFQLCQWDSFFGLVFTTCL